MSPAPPLPRRMYFLWLQGMADAPPLIEACLKSWQTHHPHWQIECLYQAALDASLDPADKAITKKMSRAALSDLVRLILLAQSGGVWVDATTACRTPLDGWLPDMMGGGFFAFDRPGPDRPIASWFMAAVPGHPLVLALLSATRQIWQQPHVTGVDPPDQSRRYLDASAYGPAPWRQTAFWRERATMPYFWLHYLFDYLLHSNADFRNRWTAVPKWSAHIPQSLARRGLLRPGANQQALKTAIQESPAPLHKLNWRKHNLTDQPALKTLFNSSS